MGRAPLRAGDGLRHRSGAGACGPAPRVKTLAAYMAAYNPTCSLYACDVPTSTRAALPPRARARPHERARACGCQTSQRRPARAHRRLV